MNHPLAHVSVMDLHGRRIDFDAGVIQFRGRSRRLTHQAGEVLRALVAAMPEVCTREALIDGIWSGNYLVGNRSLPSVFYALRQALNDQSDPPIIKTCPRIGYRLLAHPVAGSSDSCGVDPEAARGRPLNLRRVAFAAGLTGLMLAGALKVAGPEVQIRISREAKATQTREPLRAGISRPSDQTVRASHQGDETAAQTPARQQE